MKEKLTFKKNTLIINPITYWEVDGYFIGMYQGNRGGNPELDFVVKYVTENKRLRQPSHIHWVVDLLLKANNNKFRILELVNDFLFVYDDVKIFENVNERDNHELTYYKKFKDKYSDIIVNEDYSVSFIFSLIELFSHCEKQTKGAFMFKTLLNNIKDYCENKKDFYTVINMAKRV